MSQEQGKMSFADGCHRYGWLITIVVNFVLLAYFVGGQTQQLTDIHERVGRLEHQLDEYISLGRAKP